METPLNASSTTAGGLFSGGRFRVPEFQREYAWGNDEVEEFFTDLSGALTEETYFLGLVILTGEGQAKDVVDGQQRILTLTLLAAAITHEAVKYERQALADRLQSTFLRSIDYQTDEEVPRVSLSSVVDHGTLRRILARPASDLGAAPITDVTVSDNLLQAYGTLSDLLIRDLSPDAFRRLGTWADFITNRLYFAVFVHPDPASAYRVFEVINTRGKELTTADLLKSYVLSQTSASQRGDRYGQWQNIARAFSGEGSGSFVQFIRHAVTLTRGHVLPRDLYDVLTGRGPAVSKISPAPPLSPDDLLALLEKHLPLYAQATDPTLAGPASSEQLAVFSVLNALNVVSVRPILLAIAATPRSTEGMRKLLELVVRRVVVGNLGTGAVERRFGQVAQRIASEGAWENALASLDDLQPGAAEFQDKVATRSMNRNVLGVLRSSVLQNTMTPDLDGNLYFIKPRSSEWAPQDEDRAAYWVSTIGNSFLAHEARRPMGSSSWQGFKAELLPKAVDHEWIESIEQFERWGVDEISQIGAAIAEGAVAVWYE